MLRRRTIIASAAVIPLMSCTTQRGQPVPEDGVRHAYGDHRSQFGTLHRPKGRSRGVLVVIHGGFWRATYDASLGTPLAVDLAGRGWTVWNLEYRRIGDQGGVPQTLDDVAAGIDHLDELEVDTSTVVTLGHSAGGHLATWAASRGRFPSWPERVKVTHVVSQSGVLDLVAGAEAELGTGAVQAFCGGEPSEVPEAYRWADPTQQIPLDVPLWCVHAPDDETVPIRQSRDYVERSRAAGAKAKLVEVPGGHFGVIEVGSRAWSQIVGVLDHIGRQPLRTRVGAGG